MNKIEKIIFYITHATYYKFIKNYLYLYNKQKQNFAIFKINDLEKEKIKPFLKNKRQL